jgi:hypothetical protein
MIARVFEWSPMQMTLAIGFAAKMLLDGTPDEAKSLKWLSTAMMAGEEVSEAAE